MLQVGNDAPESLSMGWYMQSLYLTFPTIGKMYPFDCKEWLSTNRGNKKRTCNLKISNTNIVKFKASELTGISLNLSKCELYSFYCYSSWHVLNLENTP